MIKSNTNILIDVLYFSANMSYIEYKPSVAVLPYQNIMGSTLFEAIYDIYNDTIYQIKER
jgi:hypothetical protein|nr:MAG TPA: hypothetical protein [Bacteriophage sp.]